MTPETTFTLTLTQLITGISVFAGTIITAVGTYWRLSIKTDRNKKEMMEIERTIRYDIVQRFALLSMERKNCNENHTHKIERLEAMLIDDSKKINAMVANLSEQTRLLQALTVSFQKHETYHETIEKLSKK